MTVFDSTNDTCTACGQPSAFHDYEAHKLGACGASSPQADVPCPCTLIEQDESCPISYPSLLCGVCNGIGHTTQEQVTALACEMIKIASDIGGPEDPFAAWESIDLIKSQHKLLRSALKPLCGAAPTHEDFLQACAALAATEGSADDTPPLSPTQEGDKG